MVSHIAAPPRSKADYVAQLLLERIIEGKMAPGSSFGTEAELLAQYDVSRPTLRESLRILEAQGVLAMRPGPKGGIIVTKPGMDILAHGLSVYLRLHNVPFLEILKAREVIEPALAAGAAENASDEDIVTLQASVDAMKAVSSQSEFVEENRRFHSLVAQASRNEVMAIFWETISILAAGEQYGVSYSAKNQRHVVEAHQGITDAIRARDGKAAAALMAEHLGDLEQLLGKRYQNLMGQATQIIGRNGAQIG